MSPPLRFASFEIRPAERLLLRDGEPVRLGSRAFDVLLALVERAGRLVTKSELLDLAWPGLVVEEANIQVHSGIFGEMMLTYFQGRGGAGVVINGCVRDWTNIQQIEGLGLWLENVTPNFHTQTNLIPFAVNVPIGVNNVLVMPGDIIVADDDGVVVVPVALAEELVKKASAHVEWEEFSRIKLSEGGDLRKYYPLSPEAQVEYEAWKKANGK